MHLCIVRKKKDICLNNQHVDFHERENRVENDKIVISVRLRSVRCGKSATAHRVHSCGGGNHLIAGNKTLPSTDQFEDEVQGTSKGKAIDSIVIG